MGAARVFYAAAAANQFHRAAAFCEIERGRAAADDSQPGGDLDRGERFVRSCGEVSRAPKVSPLGRRRWTSVVCPTVDFSRGKVSDDSVLLKR